MKKSNAKRNRCYDDVKAAIWNRHKNVTLPSHVQLQMDEKLTVFLKQMPLKKRKSIRYALT